MLYYPKSLQAEDGRLVVHIPESAFFIEKWAGLGEKFTGLSIRWAAGRDVQGALVVIGVRHEGRGFDVAFRKEAWDQLAQEPELLVIRYGADFNDSSKETVIEIPDGSFGDFIETCQRQAADDPQKTVIGELARYFE
ncbi:hypothetical protein [Effusibacillus consociatus]|uniref:Uncharacterized protein n=1 Tax=Effusibacillus consociatus TaxID=1117041 RepID=A0ABV9Q5R7_9BACL